jgi:hypothetical protein
MRRDNCEAITIRQQLTQCPYEGGQQWWMQMCFGLVEKYQRTLFDQFNELG